MLQDIQDETHLAYNQQALANALYDGSGAAAVVNDVNASIAAFNKINSAVGGDASTILDGDFTAILGLVGYSHRN